MEKTALGKGRKLTEKAHLRVIWGTPLFSERFSSRELHAKQSGGRFRPTPYLVLTQKDSGEDTGVLPVSRSRSWNEEWRFLGQNKSRSK